MTWFAHRCNFCGHKSREVDFVVGDRVWQCVWENRDACYERRWEQRPWERPETVRKSSVRDREFEGCLFADLLLGRVIVEEYVAAVKAAVDEAFASFPRTQAGAEDPVSLKKRGDQSEPQ